MEMQRFELPDDLTISNLATFKSDVANFISSTQEIEFNDNAVSKIDSVGIQLLLTIINEVITQEKIFSWKISSPALQENIRQLGLENSDFNKYL